MVRQLDFADGFESAAPPSQGVVQTGGFGSYSSDAAFVSALTGAGGALGAGNAYFNSVDGRMHVYDGVKWTVSVITIGSVLFLAPYANDASYIAALAAAGGTLVNGATYYNATSKFIRTYDGTTWHESLTGDGAQVITNKDFDGGTATASRRLTLPKGTFAALNALPRKAGNFYFATDGAGAVYMDNGTVLVSVVGAPVSSVNGYVGVVVLVTDDVAEGATNLYFTDARAKAAAVADAITNGVTDVAPSQNAVFDALALKEDTANKGAVGGYASLDGAGKIPVAQIPDTVVGAVDYQGVWNANTNSPDLGASSPVKGDYWVVGTAGTGGSLGGYTDWMVNDWAIFNGTIWQKVDNTDQVSSVNGLQGAVVLTTDQVAEGATNKYFTDGRAQTAVVVDSIADADTTHAPSRNSVFDALALKQDAANTAADARAAVVIDSIADADTNHAPSRNAVFDALALKKDTSQVENEAHGGTNQSTYATGDTLYASASNTLAKRTIGNTGQVSKVVAGIPQWKDWIEGEAETRLFEDWIGDGVATLRWLNASTGTAAAASTALTVVDVNHPGVVSPTTGTTTTGAGAGYLGGVTSGTATSGFLLGGGALMFEWLVQVPTLSNGTDTFQCTLGMVDAVTGATAGIFFQYQQTTNVNWLAVTRSASTSTTTDTGIVVNAGSWYKLRAMVNAAGTSVDFYINDVLAVTNTTNIPTATVIAPRFNIIKSAGTTARSMYIDFFKLYQRFTTAR